MKKIALIITVSVIACYSCKKELKSIQIDRDEITMNYDENKQLNVSYSPSDVEVPPIFNWESEDENIVTVSETGLVEGVRVGETNVFVRTDDAKFEDVCKVIIEPISNLYKEPVIEIGQSKSYVKSKETRAVSYEDSEALIYDGENTDVDYVIYMFELNKLTSSSVLLVDETSLIEEANTFLDERYDFVGALESVIFYRINSKVVAGLTYDVSLGLVIIYMENTDLKSTNSMLNSFQERIIQLRMQNSNSK